MTPPTWFLPCDPSHMISPMWPLPWFLPHDSSHMIHPFTPSPHRSLPSGVYHPPLSTQVAWRHRLPWRAGLAYIWQNALGRNIPLANRLCIFHGVSSCHYVCGVKGHQCLHLEDSSIREGVVHAVFHSKQNKKQHFTITLSQVTLNMTNIPYVLVLVHFFLKTVIASISVLSAETECLVCVTHPHSQTHSQGLLGLMAGMLGKINYPKEQCPVANSLLEVGRGVSANRDAAETWRSSLV